MRWGADDPWTTSVRSLGNALIGIKFAMAGQIVRKGRMKEIAKVSERYVGRGKGGGNAVRGVCLE